MSMWLCNEWVVGYVKAHGAPRGRRSRSSARRRRRPEEQARDSERKTGRTEHPTNHADENPDFQPEHVFLQRDVLHLGLDLANV